MNQDKFVEEIKEMFKIDRLEIYEISDLQKLYDQIWDRAYEAGFGDGVNAGKPTY